MGIDSLADVRPPDAFLSWILIGALVLIVIERLRAGDILWAGFAATVIAVALVPAILTANPSVMVSWTVLFPSAIPALARVVDVFVGPLAYLSVAALGLLVVAEIDRFTRTEMPGWFAAWLVVMVTMSVSSAWTIVRYGANRWIGTEFAATVNALMWELAVATAVGIATGVVFERLLRDREEVERG